MINIIMIEDDPDFSEFLGDFLAKYNIKITNFQDPFLGLCADFTKYDLLILDLTLPGMDGLEVCQKISQKHDIPIIISSARSDVTDKVLGLQTGADYYLPKPYDPKEMYAVIQTLLRRKNKILSQENDMSIFKLDESKNTILFKGEELNLTYAEYEVLSCLLKNKNGIVSRETIIESCKSINNSHSRSLDVIISRIRAKLGEDSKNQKYLRSIRGLGYKLNQ